MPRKPRSDTAETVHHVTTLGNRDERIFRDADDRNRFLQQLGKVVALYEWSCQGYCLMDTHFHLILYTPESNLSRGMQHLCGPYAQWFNWKYERNGHLFGRRFSSSDISRDEHLFAAHRYIALNPVHAGLCDDPARWRWGSFRALCGLEPPAEFLELAPVLELFGESPDEARVRYRRFVTAGV